MDGSLVGLLDVTDVVREVGGNLRRQLLADALGEDFGGTIVEGHVHAVADYNYVGAEVRAGETGELLLNVVLGVAVDGSTVGLTTFANWGHATVKLHSGVAPTREGVDDKDGVVGPSGGWSEFDDFTGEVVSVAPVVEHLQRVDPTLGFAVHYGTGSGNFIVIAEAAVLDVLDLVWAVTHYLVFERIEQVVHVEDAKFVASLY